jgi:hypothetical protein
MLKTFRVQYNCLDDLLEQVLEIAMVDAVTTINLLMSVRNSVIVRKLLTSHGRHAEHLSEIPYPTVASRRSLEESSDSLLWRR